MSGILGSFVAAQPPSDHLPTTLTITICGPGPARRRRLHAHVAGSATYRATWARKLEMLSLIGSPARHLQVVAAAHWTAKVAEASVPRPNSQPEPIDREQLHLCFVR